MNIKEFQRKLVMWFFGLLLALAWFGYAIVIKFDFNAMLNNPKVWVFAILSLLPIGIIIANKIKV